MSRSVLQDRLTLSNSHRMKTSVAFKSKRKSRVLPNTCVAKIQEASKAAIFRCAGSHGQHENACGTALYDLPSHPLIACSNKRCQFWRDSGTSCLGTKIGTQIGTQNGTIRVF